MGYLAGLFIAFVGLVALRQWLLYRPWRPIYLEPLKGVVYEVGEAAIAERPCEAPRATVIAVYGFLESSRYFTRFYDDPNVQLLALTSCDYHLAFDGVRRERADWARAPDAPPGSIEYDAAVLVQALEHLPRSDKVRVHGHSRGGAVVLEAAATRPDLFKEVEVVLEAPVLPGARFYRAPSTVGIWLLPFLMPLWRWRPVNRYNRGAFGPLDEPHKRGHVEALPFNAKRAVTLVANLRSMLRWMATRDASVYEHVAGGVVLVPGRDRVLDARAMLESARRAGARLGVVELEGCSHFPLLDSPARVPPLAALGGAGVARVPEPALER